MRMKFVICLILKCAAITALSPHIRQEETPIAKHLKHIEIETTSSGVEGIDAIYVINLDTRPDKWARVKGLFAERGLHVNRVSGVNGWHLPRQTIEEICGPYPIHFTLGHYGCLLSHLSVLKNAYEKGFNRIWISEDDIEFLEDVGQIPRLINKLEALDPEWDVFFTDCKSLLKQNEDVWYVNWKSHPRPDEEVLGNDEYYLHQTMIDPEIIRIRARSGTTSMVISRRGIKKLLDYFTHVYIYAPIDIDMHLTPDLHEYTPNRAIVTNWVESDSDTVFFVKPYNALEEAEKAFAAKEYAQALEHFEKRAADGGDVNEVFWSLYKKGVTEEMLGKEEEVFCQSYLRASEILPSRAEPLYKLASHYRLKGNYLLGFLYAEEALKRSVPQATSHIDQWIYEWGSKLEYSICAYYLDNLPLFKQASEELLASPTTPYHVRQNVIGNLSFLPKPPPQRKSIAEHTQFFFRSIVEFFKDLFSFNE